MEVRQQSIYLEIPTECRDADDHRQYVWMCKKSPYGINDAPRAWFVTFSKWICEQGRVPLSRGPCTFKFADKDGNLIGQLGVHVDDEILSGNQEFKNYMIELLKTRWHVKNPSFDKALFLEKLL